MLIAFCLIALCGCSHVIEDGFDSEIPFSVAVAIKSDASNAKALVTLTNVGEKKLEILQPPLASRSTYYLNGKKEVHGVSIQFGSLPEKYPAKGNLGPSEEQEYEFSYSIIDGNLEDHLFLQAAGIKDGEVHVELNIVYQRGWGKEMTLCGVFPQPSHRPKMRPSSC